MEYGQHLRCGHGNYMHTVLLLDRLISIDCMGIIFAVQLGNQGGEEDKERGGGEAIEGQGTQWAELGNG